MALDFSRIPSSAQWARSIKNPDVSTGLLPHLFACSLALLTCLLAHSLGSLPHSWESEWLDDDSICVLFRSGPWCSAVAQFMVRKFIKEIVNIGKMAFDEFIFKYDKRKLGMPYNTENKIAKCRCSNNLVIFCVQHESRPAVRTCCTDALCGRGWVNRARTSAGKGRSELRANFLVAFPQSKVIRSAKPKASRHEWEKRTRKKKWKNKERKNDSDRVQTSDAFWRSARVLVSESSIKWYNFMSLMIFCNDSVQRSHFLDSTCLWRTDRRTDQRTDGRSNGHTLLQGCDNASKNTQTRIKRECGAKKITEKQEKKKSHLIKVWRSWWIANIDDRKGICSRV